MADTERDAGTKNGFNAKIGSIRTAVWRVCEPFAIGLCKRLKGFFSYEGGSETLLVRAILSVAFVIFVAMAAEYNFQSAAPADPDGDRGFAIWIEDKTRSYVDFLVAKSEEIQKRKTEYDHAAIREHLNTLESLDLENLSQDELPDELRFEQRPTPAEITNPNTAKDVFTRKLVSRDVIRVTLINAIFVSIYAVLIFITTRPWLGPEAQRKWADSVYFYGFILTLLSLIIALSSPGRYSGLGLTTVVIQNAIALSSTVLALFFRQFLVLFIRIKEDLREDDEVLLGLKNQADETAAKLKMLCGTVSKFDTTVKKTEKAVSDSGDVFTSEVGNIAASLKAKADEISAIEIDKDLIAREMAKAASLALEKVQTEIDALANALETGTGNITDRAEQIASAMNAFTTAILEGTQNSRTGLSRFSTVIDEGSRKADGAFDRVVKTIDSGSDQFTQGMQRFADRLGTEGLEDFKSRLGSAVDDIVQQFATDAERIGEAATGLVDKIKDARTPVDELNKTTSDVTAAFSNYVRKLEDNQEALDVLTAEFEKLSDALTGTVFEPDWLQTHGEKLTGLAEEMASLRTSLDSAMTNLKQFSVAVEAITVRSFFESVWGWATWPYRKLRSKFLGR